MTLLVFLFIVTCFLAYSNGANDNFKGVATLYGSNTTSYRGALTWGTVTTFAGSLSAIFLAQTLLRRFTGKGLVPDTIAATPDFLLAVATGAALTVMLATVIGFPISTTHSLTGALVGAGFAAVGTAVNVGVLGTAFFLPLLLSPLLAVLFAAGAYLFFRMMRQRLGITKESCICVSEARPALVAAPPDAALLLQQQPALEAKVGTLSSCVEQYAGTVAGIGAQRMLDAAHYLSAGVVSFARGLNDTPKIVAMLVAVQAFSLEGGMVAIGIAMALGGVLNARKVAVTMGKKITPMNTGQGFTANLVTGFLVVFASRLGVPVSTTHVSVGSLVGIGVVTRQGHANVMRDIFLSWVLTLPVAALLSAGVYWLVSLPMG